MTMINTIHKISHITSKDLADDRELIEQFTGFSGEYVTGKHGSAPENEKYDPFVQHS